jgi:16S rRNA G1207 methylase RsmC
LHYFDSGAEYEELQIFARLEGASSGLREQFVSARGVFSADGLDKGTAVLLKYLHAERSQAVLNADEMHGANILDLGCGWGPISLALARRFPTAQIWGVDINANAVRALEQNAKKHGLSNIQAVLPDAVPAGVEFRALVSNPPIRIGQRKLHELLALWSERLENNARILLVVQKNLGSDTLARHLNAKTFPGLEKLASSKGFRILGR